MWPGNGAWTGPVEVAYSKDAAGDVILTVPRACVTGSSPDGMVVDIIVPLALITDVAKWAQS